MTIYGISYGSIAAIQHIATSDGQVYSAISMNPELTEYSLEVGRGPSEPMPDQVRAIVEERFNRMFSAPIEERAKMVKEYRDAGLVEVTV